MPDHLPPEFLSAWERGAREVREVIQALAEPSAHVFLVYEERHQGHRVTFVGALYAKELLKPNPEHPMFTPWTLRRGTLADALRRSCPRCGKEGWLYCNEYADRQFDPDWHSDLHVLCLSCPHVEVVVHDYEGFHTPASSG